MCRKWIEVQKTTCLDLMLLQATIYTLTKFSGENKKTMEEARESTFHSFESGY